MKGDRFILPVLLLLAAAAIFGMVQLLSWRFQSGDIYPAYSSFRADPKGSKILYRSLEELPGVTVQRQLEPFDVEFGEGMTLVMLGHSRFSHPHEVAESLHSFIRSGGRVIWAYEPQDPRLQNWNTDEQEPEEETAEENESDNEPEESAEEHDSESETDDEAEDTGEPHDPKTCESCRKRARRDALRVGYTRWLEEELEDPEAERRVALPTQAAVGARPLPWQSAAWLEPKEEDVWTALYTLEDRPVVMERSIGKGSIVVLTDSYLFSNEAMVLDRHTALLTEWFGGSDTLVFDEFHLGVSSKESIMMLVHRYRMQSVLLAFGLLAGLYVWQRTAGFVPKYRDPAAGHNDVGSGIRSSDGLVNLLMRHVPRKQLPEAMVKEWKETFGRRPGMERTTKQVEAALKQLRQQDAKPDERAWYNGLVKHFKERKRYGRFH